MDKSFQHTPLNDAKQQIRLLWIHGRLQNGCLSVLMGAFDRDHGPQYNAISYTWGDSNGAHEEIFVNGKSLWVRDNCWNSLYQAHMRYPGMYVWIDSICINQNDDAEKTKQVEMMESVYLNAKKVLACIGRHADGSERLVPVVRAMSHHVAALSGVELQDLSAKNWRLQHNKRDVSRVWGPWLRASFDEKERAGLRAALQAFVARPYWTRVWVIQEAAAASSIELLIGSDAISWTEIHFILELIGTSTDKQPPDLWSLDGKEAQAGVDINMLVVTRAKRTFTTLDSALAITDGHACSEPRDHVYGILCLIQWSALPIVPDYRKSAPQVVVDAIPHCKTLTAVGMLFQKLRLHFTQPEFLSTLVPKHDESRHRDRVTPEARTTIEIGDPSGPSTCTILEKNIDGSLSALLHNIDGNLLALFHDAEDYNDTCEETTQRLLDSCEILSEQHQLRPQYVLVKGRVGAVVCSNATAGDILVPLHSIVQIAKPLLVVRHNHKDTYDVVGQGFCLPAYEEFRAWNDEGGNTDSRTESLFKADVRFRTTVPEIMRLVGQDFVLEYPGHDPEARARRVFTDPVDEPLVAVEITRVQPGRK